MHLDEALRPGLAFMTFHFPDDVSTNRLTSDRVDPLVGTAEFKATAVCIETKWTPDPNESPDGTQNAGGEQRHDRDQAGVS